MFTAFLGALASLSLGTNPYETNLRAFGSHMIQTRPAVAVASDGPYVFALQDDGFVARTGYTPYAAFRIRRAIPGVMALDASEYWAAYLVRADSLVVQNTDGGDGPSLPRLGPIRDFSVTDTRVVVLPDTGGLRCWQAHPADTQHCALPRIARKAVGVASAPGRLLAILDDSSVVEWSEYLVSDSTIPPIPALRGVVSVAGSSRTSYALLGDGTVRAWGALKGISGTLDRIKVRDVLRIAAGEAGAILQKQDGTVFVVGSTQDSVTRRLSALDGSVEIVVGSSAALGRMPDGRIVSGNLNSLAEAPGVPRLGRVVEVAANKLSAIAIREDGSAISWGKNRLELPGPYRACAIANFRILLLRRDGTLQIFGSNLEIGSGDTIPGVATVPPDLNGITHIAALGRCNIAIQDNGATRVWGDTSEATGCALHLPATLSGVEKIHAYRGGLVVVSTDGSIRTWGLLPESVSKAPKVLSGWATIPLGGYRSAVLDAEGRISSWSDDTLPLDPALDRSIGWKQVSTVQEYVAALGHDGSVHSVGAVPAPWLTDRLGRLDSMQAASDGTTLFGFAKEGGSTSIPSASPRIGNGLRPGDWDVTVHDAHGRRVWSGTSRYDGRRWDFPVTSRGLLFVRVAGRGFPPSRVLDLDRH